jgi:hypothetical protein
MVRARLQVGGDDLGQVCLEAGRQGEAVDAGQLNVRENEARTDLAQDLQRQLGIHRGAHFVPVLLQRNA